MFGSRNDSLDEVDDLGVVPLLFIFLEEVEGVTDPEFVLEIHRGSASTNGSFAHDCDSIAKVICFVHVMGC